MPCPYLFNKIILTNCGLQKKLKLCENHCVYTASRDFVSHFGAKLWSGNGPTGRVNEGQSVSECCMSAPYMATVVLSVRRFLQCFLQSWRHPDQTFLAGAKRVRLQMKPRAGGAMISKVLSRSRPKQGWAPQYWNYDTFFRETHTQKYFQNLH